MELGLSNTLLTSDPRLIDHIVGEVKSQGIFDQFRKECIADVDTKPAYQNLRTRVEGSVNSFLSKQAWRPDLNKNQLRETLRKHVHDAPYLDAGVERIVDQVVNPKVYSVFMSQIEDVVYKFMGMERPKAKEKNGACGLKDLLPKDLDPVSPESDKNSLKDESLDSLDINDDFDKKQNEKVDEQRPQDEEIYRDKNRASSENGHLSLEEKTSDEAYKILSKNGSNSNLNTSAKSDDKVDEEEEEVSPTFEPIDIMNLNESNISNDSHLSGISELTSHRSRSPDFSNELSRDNFEYSNQDSQLSKVSSDSRLSIVTDFGSSNHALTPVHDSSRDETTKDKYETKSGKDNFKAIRELESSKNKTTKSSFDFDKNKDVQDFKDTKDFKGSKSVSSKENSRDATDSSIKDKCDHKSKEKSKDSESTKISKSTKEKSTSKDTKYYKDKSNERKRSSEKYDKHNSDKYDKHSKSKPKDKMEPTRENSDKIKDVSENLKNNTNKLKDEKPKEIDKKDNVNKEVKDLKDIYKEKIRELREKKELTEKEKLNKDKDVKLIKETKDRKDPLKDKKSNKKEHKSSSSSSLSSSKNPSISYHENKSSKPEKIADGKDKRSDSKDKIKRDERRLSRESKGKSHYSSKSDLSDKSDKSDSKKISKSEKEDKSGKVDAKKDVKVSGEKTTNGKKDAKSHLQQSKNSDRVEKSDARKESKSDSPSKDKKRREDKKSKTKDDHSSLRKNSNDRRSTDRDGSNGSNNKTLPSSNSNSNVTSTKSSTSNLTKDNHVSNSGSETSDSIEEAQVSDSKTSHQSNCKLSHKISLLSTNEKSQTKMETDNSNESHDKHEEEENADPHDTNLPLKKRQLSDKDDESTSDVKLKKPKFAKNIHEAKKLMKIRKQMEKQKLKEDKKVEKKVAPEADQTSQLNTKNNLDNLEGVPDDERVQIIEISDEEYEEPYPEKHEPRLMLDERSIIMPGTESCTNDLLKELCTGQSSNGVVSNVPSEEAQISKILDSKTDEQHDMQSNDSRVEGTKEASENKDNSEEDSKNQTKHTIVDEEKCRLQAEETCVSLKLEEAATLEKSESLSHNESKNVKQSAEENTAIRDCNQAETPVDNEETKNDDTLEIPEENKESSEEKQIEMLASSKADTIESHTDVGNESSSSVISEDNEDCRYFKTDNEKSERFSNFFESLEFVQNSSLEDILESLGGRVVSSLPKPMAAPPLPKLRKRSSSPLSDILVNNSDNNNDGHKQKLSSLPNEDAGHNVVKKRKFTKKPRLSNLCNPQGISNGENFVMPLSPDSDVSATSDKTASSNVIKEEKSQVRNRTSHQRYSSDDLYKPRPLFSSSSRRSRRSNQA